MPSHAIRPCGLLAMPPILIEDLIEVAELYIWIPGHADEHFMIFRKMAVLISLNCQ